MRKEIPTTTWLLEVDLGVFAKLYCINRDWALIQKLGGPLAAKLAKNGFSVLLLEAGDDQGHSLNETVAAFGFLAQNDPSMRWDFFVKYHSDPAITNKFEHLVWRTTDAKFYVGLDPPPGATQLGVYYPRAGTLGGCSTHNAIAAALPGNSNWDIIAELTGDKSWKKSQL
jgi:choline dehydrogenase